MANIFQEQITAQKPKALSEERIYVYVPRVTETTPGIATYDSTYFGIDNGQVYLKLTDPTVLPSLVKIRNGDDGLIYEDGYVKTYLKTLDGVSLIGDTDIDLVTINNSSLIGSNDLKLVTLNTPQVIEAYKTFQVEYNNAEAFIVTTNTPGDKAFIAYPDKVVLTNGANYTHYKANSIVNNDYTLTFPNKTDTLAVQSDIDTIDDALDTKVDKVVISGNQKTTITNSGSDFKVLSEVIGTSGQTQIWSNTNVAGFSYQHIDNKQCSELGLFASIPFAHSTDGTNTTELAVYPDGVKINNVVIPKVVSENSTSAVDAYNTIYINNLKDTINNNIAAIVIKIPEQASADNQLADKNFVNSSINNMAAYYITYNVQGDAFPTKADLTNATTVYSGGEVRAPTRNDYCIVRADETQDNATVRYSYQNGQWEFQYVVNETPMTAAQVAAINSGITNLLVTQITTNQNAITALQSDKQNVLTAGANITISGDTISATDTMYSAGTGIVINGTTIGVDTNTVQSKSNKTTTITASSTDIQYPSAKAVYTMVGNIDILLTALDSGEGV